MINRFVDNNQDLKQFSFSGPSTVLWIFKRIAGTNVVTPSVTKYPFEIDNDLIIKGDLYVEGTINNPSDETLKTHITPLDASRIELVTTLNPIHFQYKADPHGQTHFGLLAQEVEKVYPELVKIDPVTTAKCVNYQELTPILIGSLKNIDARLKQLEHHVYSRDNVASNY